ALERHRVRLPSEQPERLPGARGQRRPLPCGHRTRRSGRAQLARPGRLSPRHADRSLVRLQLEPDPDVDARTVCRAAPPFARRHTALHGRRTRGAAARTASGRADAEALVMEFPDVDQLLEQASRAAGGLTDFGVGHEQGLALLVDEIRRRIPISERNIQQLTGVLIAVLVSRLYSQRGWKERPECLMQPIDAPLVVVGIPRSGTTALHK